MEQTATSTALAAPTTSQQTSPQQINSHNLSTLSAGTSSELDQLISAFASPVPSHILTDYDNKSRRKHVHGQDNESALEHLELRGPVFREFTIHIFESINFLQNLPPISYEDIQVRMIDLPYTKPGVKKTIIFDLDETLAHCVRQENPNRPSDVYLDIMTMSGKTVRAGFNIRPFTHECLEMVNKHFEVIVFTASHRGYADVILDHIDPDKKLIQHRVYRDNCVKTRDNVYVKDLRIFKNRDLKDMIIVDNAVYSFGAQLANGIPITPFKDDKEDREFQYLMNYLLSLKDYDDMRELNKEAFKMEQVYQFKLDPFIEYYNYDLCDEKSDDEYDSGLEEEKSTAEFTEQIYIDDTESQSSRRRCSAIAESIAASIGPEVFEDPTQAAAASSSTTAARQALMSSSLKHEKLNSINCMQNLAAAVERQRTSASAGVVPISAAAQMKKRRPLPKSINNCLDEFTKNIAKAQSFHQKINKRLLKKKDSRAVSMSM